MSDVSSAIEDIRQAAARCKNLADFAREAGVPYTTVRSFADRHWSHKNLEAFQKLADAAKRINSRPAEAAE